MRLLRQLGTWGSALVFTPILWILACIAARALAQHAFETNITPWTRNHRVKTGAIPAGGTPVTDRRVLTELSKYVQVWSLEVGACEAFPDGSRVPFSFNPFHPSALMLRLKQKQAFILMQKHVVLREGPIWYLAPDPQAALGGRRFRLETQGSHLMKAYEL
ncbi:MAG TPA: hypothetical protein VJ505_10825 [Holophagaceae bacterium]|nr:hypothetical protein [Holophagaceae bacterium]